MAFQPKMESNLGSVLNPKMKNKDVLLQSDGRKAEFTHLQNWREEHGGNGRVRVMVRG